MKSKLETTDAEKRSYHHPDLRSALIEAGLAIIESRDLDQLSLREVARAAEVSATAVYRHFPDKSALLEALSLAGYERLAEAQKKAALRARGDVAAAFNATGYAYVRFALDHPGLFRLIFSSGQAKDMFAKDLENENSAMALLRSYAAQLTPKGASKDAAADFALTAWALVHGLAVLLLDRQITLTDKALMRLVDMQSLHRLTR